MQKLTTRHYRLHNNVDNQIVPFFGRIVFGYL
jgi:hypothetical protein